MAEEAKKFYLNEGHSENDPGAVGYVVERKQNVIVGGYVEKYLEANFVVSVKESKGTVDSLTIICNEANAWGADFFLSIHFNAYKPEYGDGHEILVYSEANREIGEVFDKHLKAIGQNSRGVKVRPDLGVLRLTNMKAVLVECAFVDTWEDIKDWNEDHELKVMGEAIAKAVAEVMNLPKKKKEVKTTTYVTLGGMNFRKKADVDSEKIGSIPAGTAIAVQSVNDDGWGKLTYKGKTGYVRIKSKTKTYCVKATAYKTLSEMNFRAKPSTAKDVKILGQIPAGKKIYVQSVDKNGWGKVPYYKGKSGYVRVKGEKTYCKKV